MAQMPKMPRTLSLEPFTKRKLRELVRERKKNFSVPTFLFLGLKLL